MGQIPCARKLVWFDLFNQIGAVKLYVKSLLRLEALSRWQGKSFEEFSGGQTLAARLL